MVEWLAPLVSTLVISHHPLLTPMLQFLAGIGAGWPVTQEHQGHLTINFYIDKGVIYLSQGTVIQCHGDPHLCS